MKKFVIFLLVIFGICEIYSNVIINSGVITYDKFKIYHSGGVLHCGTITCSNAVKCIITQKNDQNDNTKLITREKCFNENDDLVNSSEVTETAGINENNVNIRIELGPNGHYVLRTKSEEEIKKDMEALQKRLEQERIEREERLAADAQRRALHMTEIRNRLEEQRVEREERLATDAQRRAFEMEELRNRLEQQRMEREERLAANAQRRMNHMQEREARYQERLQNRLEKTLSKY